MFRDTTLIRSALLGLAASVCGGTLCAWIGAPLPWMVGSLGAMALFNFSGARLSAVRGGQQAGQSVVAVALGLYFTPQVAGEVIGSGHWLLLAAVFALGLGHVCGALLSRLSGTDRATAFFASTPGGAAEMSLLGEIYGARVERIALAQSLRILLVVCTVPMAITLLGVHGTDVFTPVPVPVTAGGLGMLLATAGVTGYAALRLGLPTPFFFGPLVWSIGLTVSGSELSAIPAPLLNAAQVLIGCALGSRFSREFVKHAPRFVAASASVILLGIVLSALFGTLIAWWGGLSIPTVILATAPGGITELCVTAKVLQLGVPFVTAAHVTRVLVLISLTGPIYRWLNARSGAGGK